MPYTVPKLTNRQSTKFHIQIYYQHQLELWDHWRRRTCLEINIIWEVPAECISVRRREHKRHRKELLSNQNRRFGKQNGTENDNEFECYDNSEGKPVHVDINKEAIEGNKPILTLKPNRSEEDKISKNGGTCDGDSDFSSHKSNLNFTPLERLCSVPCFYTQKWIQYFYQPHPIKTTQTETDDDGGHWVGQRHERSWWSLPKQVADWRRGEIYGGARIFGYAMALNEKLFLENILYVH